MGAGSSEPAAEDNIQMASGEISFLLYHKLTMDNLLLLC